MAHMITNSFGRSSKAWCDFGYCDQPSTFVVAVQRDNATVERRPMCPKHVGLTTHQAGDVLVAFHLQDAS